jgi:hypothetical protein
MKSLTAIAKKEIYALDRRHNVFRVFTIPTQVDHQSPVYWYEIGDGRAIAEFLEPWSAGEPQNITKRMVYRIADDGSIQDRFELSLRSGTRAQNEQANSFLFALGFPVPAIVLAIQPLGLIEADPMQSYPTAVGAVLKRFWPSIVAVLALSSILAMIASRRGRAFGFSQREQVAWAVFVLLLGFPAYLGILLYRRWPIREPCPACHALAARDRAACAACGIRFPDPGLKGIEIFA